MMSTANSALLVMAVVLTLLLSPDLTSIVQSRVKRSGIIVDEEPVTLEPLTQLTDKCKEMYREDARKKKVKPDKDYKDSPGCEAGAKDCFRGECDELGQCHCCIQFDSGLAKEVSIKTKHYGRWVGKKCDIWQDMNAILQSEKPQSEEELRQRDFDKRDLRPTPSPEFMKMKKPKKCEMGSANCWRGSCVLQGSKTICQCFTYDGTDSKEPGTYGGLYCYEFFHYERYSESAPACTEATCKYGVCKLLADTEKMMEGGQKTCYCDSIARGLKCDIILQDNCANTVNLKRCKKVKYPGIEQKLKYRECKKGWTGEYCEQPGICKVDGRNICSNGAKCKSKSSHGRKLYYCDCKTSPKSKRLPTFNFFCDPARISYHQVDDDINCLTPDCNKKGHDAEVDGVTSEDSGSESDTAVQPPYSVHAQMLFEAKSPTAFDWRTWSDNMFVDPNSAQRKQLEGTIKSVVSGFPNEPRVANVQVSFGSVVVDMDVVFDDIDGNETDLQSTVKNGILENDVMLQEGLGPGYVLNKEKLVVEEPRIVNLGDETTNPNLKFILIGTFIGAAVFIVASVYTLKKIRSSHKMNMKTKQDKKNAKSKSSSGKSQKSKSNSGKSKSRLSNSKTASGVSAASRKSSKNKTGKKSKNSDHNRSSTNV